MTIDIKACENGLLISLTGRLDTATAPALEQAILGLDGAAQNVSFDFENVEYVSSAGLRVLLICQKKMSGGKRLKIINVNSTVKEIFDMTGFNGLMEVEERRDGEADSLSFRDFLRRKAETNADSTVFTFDGKAFTWRDIETNARAIAAELARQGVRKRTHVAICGLNSPHWIYTFFAIQQLGAIAVLLNFNVTPAELAVLSKIGDLTHLCYGEMPGMMADPKYMEKLSREEGVRFTDYLRITRDTDFSCALGRVPEERVEADDPAVMIFTSGSTALPKAVLLSAYNIMNNSRNIIRRIAETERDRACLVLPLFHIFGFMGVLVASMMVNAPVCIPTGFKPDVILKTLSTERCTVMFSVPTLALSLAGAPNLSGYDLSALRSISLAGAAIQPAQLRLLMEKFPRSRFNIGYGLSEIAPAAATEWGDTDEHVFNTVGRPCDDVLFRIQKPDTKRACAVGEAGEILLKSPNQMVCYYKLAIDKQPIDGEGWLHTGDLGFIAEDGYVHLVGRIKELIIRGGENIAPNEVALAISAHPAIADVKVFGVPDAHWGEVVFAALILTPGASLPDEELKEFLKPRLARFKIPTHIGRFERFPMLSNGKVDMLALKQIAQTMLGAGEGTI